MSYYTQDESWKTEELRDIIDPQNSNLNAMAQQDLQNYLIPGFHPSTVPHPEAAGSMSWSSPTGGMIFNESGNHQPEHSAETPRYSHMGLEYMSKPQMDVSRFETDSSSSRSSGPGLFAPESFSNSVFSQNRQNSTNSITGSGSGSNKNLVRHIPAQSPPSEKEKEKEKGRPKRTRGKVLNELESELISKDDALLNDDELAIKRKAQNRLAQRAFRERKESKLKDLQTKLLQSEGERQRLLEELEGIKSQFMSVKTENEVLRQTNTGGTVTPNSHQPVQVSKFTFPSSQEAFVERMMQDNGQHVVNTATVNKIYDEPQRPGRKVLAVGAVWDYLSLKIEEEEYENIDMLEVMKNLKGNEVCHGYGPAYPLELVDTTLRRVAYVSESP